MTLIIGPTTLPLVAQATGQPLTPVADAWLARAIDYWQTCINTYCEAAYVGAMGDLSPGPAGKRACQETSPVDPVPWLDVEVFRGPMLAVYPVEGKYEWPTLEHDQTTTKYQIKYILPAVSFDTAKVIAPLLQAVLATIIMVTEAQHDASYNADQRVWEAASLGGTALSQMYFGGYEMGFLVDPEDAGHALMCLSLDVTVEAVDRWTVVTDTTLVGSQIKTGIGTDLDGAILPDAVIGNSEVP